MQVAVAYAEPSRQVLLEFDMPEGATVQEAVERSGILDKFPQIDLEQQKVGVYGKLAKLDQKLASGDRVEIYRPALGKPVKKKRPPAKAGAKRPAGGPAAAKARIAAVKARAAAAKAKKAGGAEAKETASEPAAEGEDRTAKMAAAKARAAAAKAKIAARKKAAAKDA